MPFYGNLKTELQLIKKDQTAMSSDGSGLHFSSIAPCFPVADISATLPWYEQLGFRTDPFPDREPYVFAIISKDNAEIMLQRIKGYEKPDLYARRDGGVWDAYLRLSGLKEFYESV